MPGRDARKKTPEIDAGNDAWCTGMRNAALFITASILGGLGGLAGSVAGNAFGREGLFAGGFIGGVLLAPLAALLARKRGWIDSSRVRHTAAGAALGFLAAATLAVNTLSSPIGPLIATTLTGLGALAGARLGAAGMARKDE